MLDNGLTVILRPINDARSVALAVVYDVGEDHDPPGKSGLAHLLEHVYLTSAAGKIRSRSYAEFQAKYGGESNAQTGDRYTVFATVFPRHDLDRELEDAAARMGDLHIDPDEVERERSRLLVEVDNMFGSIPTLAAINLGRKWFDRITRLAAAAGCPHRSRRSRCLTSRPTGDAITNRRTRSCLSLGPSILTRCASWSKRILARFRRARLFPRQVLDRPTPHAANLKEITVRRSSQASRSIACLAFAAPPPGSALYAPFVLLVSRLLSNAATLGDLGPMSSPVYFTPLDDGAIVAVMTTPAQGENATETIKRLGAFVRNTIKPDLRLFERMTARQRLGPLLGLVETSDFMLAQNLYGVAFSLAQRDQLDLVSSELRRSWNAISHEQLRQAADQFFSPQRQAAVFVAVDDGTNETKRP